MTAGVRSQVELRGIIPSSFAHIFDSISHSTSRQFLVRASYLEIYNVSLISFLITMVIEKGEVLGKYSRSTLSRPKQTVTTARTSKRGRLCA